MKTAESAIKELISRIENAKVESRNPNNRTKRTGEYRIGLSQAINLAHDVIAELAEELASHPCPVEYPEAIIANFQPTSPMSAEQVDWKQVIKDRVNHFNDIFHTHEAKKLLGALHAIEMLVPPSHFATTPPNQDGDTIKNII